MFARVVEHKAGAGSMSTKITPFGSGANDGTAAGGVVVGGFDCGGSETGGCQWPCHQVLVMSCSPLVCRSYSLCLWKPAALLSAQVVDCCSWTYEAVLPGSLLHRTPCSSV